MIQVPFHYSKFITFSPTSAYWSIIFLKAIEAFRSFPVLHKSHDIFWSVSKEQKQWEIYFIALILDRYICRIIYCPKILISVLKHNIPWRNRWIRQCYLVIYTFIFSVFINLFMYWIILCHRFVNQLLLWSHV